MRKNFGAKSWLFPMPVLVIGTYNHDGSATAMTAAWGMICDYDKLVVCLDKSHKSVDNLLARRAFTVSLANEANMAAADLVGITSGHKTPHKLTATGWTALPCGVDAPMFDELPLTLECELESFDEESELAVGRIVNVSADEAIVTDGKPDMAKLRAVSYDPVMNRYFVVERPVGRAFHDGLSLK